MTDHAAPDDSRTSNAPPPDGAAGEIVSLYYGPEVELITPASVDEMREIVLEARTTSRTIIPTGHGGRAYLGNRPDPPVTALSLRGLDSIARYEPGDFTIGVEAGLPAETLRAELAGNGQELPLDLPSGVDATIGGLVASSWCGPRQHRLGLLRNLIIGVRALRGDGRDYRSGGMVVKNVAGFDLAKTLTGSLGTLGPLLEINFKLRPLPSARSAGLTILPSITEAWALARSMIDRRLEPTTLSILDAESLRRPGLAAGDVHDSACGVMWLFEGNAGAVDHLESGVAARHREKGLEDPAATTRDPGEVQDRLGALSALQFPDAPGREDLVILRLVTLPSRHEDLWRRVRHRIESGQCASAGWAAEPAAGVLVARIQGSQAELRHFLAGLRRDLHRHGGHGRLIYAGPRMRREEPFLLVPDPAAALARRVQRVFDPDGLFHAERLSSGEGISRSRNDHYPARD